MNYLYTEEQLKSAVISSLSIRQVLVKLNLAAHGGNYRTIKKRISKLGISTQHFTGQLWSKGRTIGHKRPIEDYLTNKFPTQSWRLGKRLVSENVLKRECSNCKLSKWLDFPIPLELHHIDGNHQNNLITNLSFLCPNCHTLTDNYRGKNKK